MYAHRVEFGSPEMVEAIARLSPGTSLRQGIDDVIRAHEGALIVIGDPEELSFLYSGGIPPPVPFPASHARQ